MSASSPKSTTTPKTVILDNTGNLPEADKQDNTPEVDKALESDIQPEGLESDITPVIPCLVPFDAHSVALARLVAAYVGSDAKARHSARSSASAIVSARIRSVASGSSRYAMEDVIRAQSVVEAFAASGSRTAATVSVDYRTIMADLVATLRHAADSIESGMVVPGGVPDGVEYDRLVVGTPDEARSLAIASASLRTGTRADLGDWLRRVLSATDGSYVAVSAIRRLIVTASGGSYTPSDGAIAARLWPSSGVCTVADVTPVERVGTRARGAMWTGSVE